MVSFEQQIGRVKRMPTDQQLKLTLAKMLSEETTTNFRNGDKADNIYWNHKEGLVKVLDTELLHLCWMVEETLNTAELYFDYWQAISKVVGKEMNMYHFIHATWQQRTLALAAIKGVEIV